MTRLASLAYVVGLLVSEGCRKDPLWCPDEPGNTCSTPDAPRTGCTSNGECSTPTPVCDVTGSMSCVQCLPSAAAACVAATPVCGDDHACRACEAHDECASGACLPDGSCAAETSVAYVLATGTGTTCTRAAPCPLLRSAIAVAKPIIKVGAAGAANDTGTVVIDGKTVTILAEAGAKLDRDGDGPILEVRSAGADVAIYDLTISGATGMSGGDGIQLTPNGGAPKLSLTRAKVVQNQGSGISATGGTLTLSTAPRKLVAIRPPP